jgi:glycosyltransferase involved in cell wall biosynthesis
VVPEISVVVPVFNEEQSLPELYQRLTALLPKHVESYEIVLVDDGSCDASWQGIKKLSESDSRVRGVRFARNFGHQMAFTAGLDHARGKAVVIMDADLQDPPEVIPELLERWREGYEIVYAQRRQRAGETAFKLLTAKLFYRTLRTLASVDIPPDTGDFRLMDRKAVDAYRRLREHNRLTRGLVTWLGFRQTGVTYDRAPRFAGEGNYPLRKMLKLASDGLTSFSIIPLQLATWAGALTSALAALSLLVSGGNRILGREWTPEAIWVSLLALLGGVQLLGLGLIGAYLGRIYDEVRGRPLYLIGETVGAGFAPEQAGATPPVA